ncbi:MAG: glycoside hydrolase family 32 protein [Turicibacter sp.]
MEWTKEQRYRKIEDVPLVEVQQLKKTVEACPYRQTFHIQPPTGLLNDPNGFSFFNGEYHLFYQWFPLGPVHGLKYWYHLSSPDLINWKDCGMALSPIEYFESHGVFSGSGIVHNDKLHLLYTGNTRDENWIRTPYQCLAIMDESGCITKHKTAVINGTPVGYTDHFRDPKVFKLDEQFHCLIGAQTVDQIGTIVAYESKDLISWNFSGEIKTSFKGNGYMWECPDYFTLNNKGILVFSPQGMEPVGDSYQNIFQSGYLVGDLIDFNTGSFSHGDFLELDRGFEFYAPQSMEDEAGRRLLVGWMGLPDVETATENNNWAHCLTVIRELTLHDDKLIQKPIKELEKLRKSARSASTYLNGEEINLPEFNGQVYELMCEFTEFTGQQLGIKLRKSDTEETVFYYDLNDKKLVLDRSLSGVICGKEFGTVRKCDFDAKTLKLQIFVDVSSIEIFVNDGLEVFTTRIFTQEESTNISFFADGCATLNAQMWSLN